MAFTGRRVSLCALLAVIFACAAEPAPLSISDAETAGFVRGDQQMFQMVGAQDGWGGIWDGDVVELYQYASESAVNEDAFAASVQPGNISGWQEMCRVRNMLMLSKGMNACVKLRELGGA